MGVYIQGMEMPTSCSECPLHKLWPIDDEVQCLVNRELWNDGSKRHKLCPLIPAPPHGRLIDADAFGSIKYELPNGQKAFNRGFHSGVQYVQRLIMDAPTILPAEEDTDFYTKGHLHLGYAEEAE